MPQPTNSVVSDEPSTATDAPVAPARTRRVPRRSWWRAHGPLVLVVAAYAACAVYGSWDAWSQGPSQYAVSGGGDQAASMWFFTWAPYSLFHLHSPLFSNFGNTPYGINMMVNTSTLPLGYLVAPVTLLAGPVVSFNVIGTLAPLLSACAAYALIRRFTTWRPAAFVGGLVYGFSPYVVAADFSHVMTVFVALPPLILLLLHDIVARQPGKPVARGLLLGLVVLVQFFISSEVLFSTILFASLALLLAAFFGRRDLRERLGYAVTALVTGAILAAAVLAYPIWFLLNGPAHVVGAVQQYPQLFRADLLGPIYPDGSQRIAPSFARHVADQFAGNGTENGSYLGLPLVMVFVVGAVALWRITVVRIAAIVGSVAFVLSLGSRLMIANHPTAVQLPEGVFDHLPLLKNTLPVRFSLYVVLSAALICGVVLDRIHAKIGSRRPGAPKILVPAALAIAVVVPLIPAWPYQMVPVATPTYFTSGAVRAIHPNDVVLFYPFPDATFANPQLWQATTFLRFKLPGGRFNVPQPVTGAAGPSRASLTDTALSALSTGTPPARTEALRSQLRAQWHAWGVRDVVAFPGGPNAASELSFLTWVLGSPPKTSAGAFVWYGWH